MRRQINSSSAQSLAAVSLVVQQLYSIDDLLGGELKGIIAPLYLLAVLPCQGAGQERSMVARPMGAGASPARTPSHCAWVRQVGRPRGGRWGQPRVEITTQVCDDDASLSQAIKSIHSSGSNPAVVTGVRNSPVVARQVSSD